MMSGKVGIGLFLVLVAVATVSALFAARHRALDVYSTAKAQGEWQTWRTDVAAGRDPQAGSVARRVPGSSEPPALVLMRDYFPVCLVGAVVFATLLAGVLCWFASGAFARSRHTQHP